VIIEKAIRPRPAVSEWVVAWAAVATLFVSTPSASADPRTEQCLTASEQGQLSRKEAKYRSARASFRVCAQSDCPFAVRRDCVEWLGELDRAQPTIIVHARAEGRDASDVTVRIDGEVLTERLDGRAIEVDPGEHLLTFESTRRRARRDHRLVVRESEKGRWIEVDLTNERESPTQTTPASTPAREPATPAIGWVLGGVGIAGIATATYLLVAGRIREADLAAECEPRCPHADVDAVRRQYWAGAIALGAGALALGAAIFVATTGSHRASQSKSRPRSISLFW